MRSRGNVFISYRREGGSELARNIREALQKRRFAVFMDVEDLRSGAFNTALYEEIEAATDVVAVLTPGSLDRCHDNPRDWVRLELAHALRRKKNVVPVQHKDFHWPDAPLPPDIESLRSQNGVPASHDFFEASMDRLAGRLLVGRAPRMLDRPFILAAAALLVVTVFVGMTWLSGQAGSNVRTPAQTGAATGAEAPASNTVRAPVGPTASPADNVSKIESLSQQRPAPITLPAEPPKSSRAQFGESRAGTIPTRGGRITFTVSASSRDVVLAILRRCNDVGGSPVTMRPVIELRDPSGAMLAAATQGNSENWASIRGQKLATSGLHSIAAGDSGELTQYSGGPFSLFVQKVNNPVRAVPLEHGSSRISRIRTCGQVDTYAFEAQQGDRIKLSIEQIDAGGMYPHVEVYDPEGTFIGEARSYNASGERVSPPGVVSWGVPENGRYTVVVMNLFGYGSGDYRIGTSLRK